jgi:heme/copper-type cytochrome/quinol oxidase subunit 4
MAQAHSAHPTPVAVAQPVHAGERAHPKPIVYVTVFFFLFVLTALEVSVTTPLWPSAILPVVPSLLALAVAKGSLIVLFYMHLKFDSRAYAGFFLAGLIIAISMILSFMALFLAHYRQPWNDAQAREQGILRSTGAHATGTPAASTTSSSTAGH